MKVKKDINGIVTTYNFGCEVCKHPFPRTIKIGSRSTQVMTIDNPEEPYIILWSLKNRDIKET